MKITPSPFHAWYLAARPWTLRAAALPVALGSALAAGEGKFLGVPALCCLLFAVLAQIFANFANDYYDYKRGADTAERTGPPRAVASGWIRPNAMRLGVYCVGALALLAGLPLIAYGGWGMMIIGLVALFFAWAYTGGPFPLGYKGLGDLAVYVFFGWIAVGFTYYVQAGALSLEAFWAGTGIGALGNNILVVTSARDRELDARVGKKTLAVRFGIKVVAFQYGANLALAALGAVALTLLTKQPLCLLAILGLPLGVVTARRLPQLIDPQSFRKETQRSARAFLIYGLLLCLGLII